MNLGSTMFLVLLSHHSLLYSMPKFKTNMNNKSTYSLFARLAKFMHVYFSLYYVLYADNFFIIHIFYVKLLFEWQDNVQLADHNYQPWVYVRVCPSGG